MRAAEEAEGRPAAPRIHPQIDVRAAGDLLTRAGFALPVADSERLERPLPGLRHSGRRPAGDGRDQHPRRRATGGRSAGVGLAAATADFEEEGGTVERFEIVHLAGWAPAPDQPRAAPRGSGSVSLADALKPRG